MRRGAKDKREALLKDSLPRPGTDERDLTDTERRLLHEFSKQHLAIGIFPEYDEQKNARRRR